MIFLPLISDGVESFAVFNIDYERLGFFFLIIKGIEF